MIKAIFSLWATKNRSRTSLLDLPDELIFQIASSLSLANLNSLIRTNHLLCDMISSVLLKRALGITVGICRQKRSVLHWASAHNRPALMMALLNLGSRDIDVVGLDGMTPLHSAIILGNEIPVLILLEHGVDRNIQNPWGWTPLVSAAIAGNERIVAMLVENGTDVNARGSRTYMRSALHFAAALGHEGVVEVMMMKMGCDTGMLDDFRLNALQCAAAEGHERVVRRMLKLGISETVGSSSHMYSCAARAVWLTKIYYKLLVACENDYCRACVVRIVNRF